MKSIKLFFVFYLLVLISGFSQEQNQGANRPTKEERDWANKNFVEFPHKKVPINKVGKSRQKDNVGIAFVTGTIPNAVDNSKLKYFPPIRSQGSLNSCASFSTMYYTYTHMTALARDWNAKTGGSAFWISPKWTYNVVNGGANVGTSPYDAYNIALKHGVATWLEFPYNSNYKEWCLNPDVWVNAIYRRASQSGRVSNVDSDLGLEQLKQLLVNGYVLNFSTYINSWVFKTITNDVSTPDDDVFIDIPCATHVNGSASGHTMAIVGYNDDIWVDVNNNGVIDGREKGALRIANSWGTTWREAGFCWLSYNAIFARNPVYSSEGIFWYDEAMWITAREFYTPKMLAEFNINHTKRNQLRMNLGISSISTVTPTASWYPNKVLSYAGGAYAFNGTTNPIAVTFYLDFTDIVSTTAGVNRYYLGATDNIVGFPLILNSFSIIDLEHNQIADWSGPIISIDGTQYYAYIDYATDIDFINPPTGLSYILNYRTVKLIWTDNSNNETGFIIERGVKQTNGTVFTIIAQVNNNITTFTDVLPAAGSYSYRVQSINIETGQQSIYSNTTSLKAR
jgi:hypothetical protein